MHAIPARSLRLCNTLLQLALWSQLGVLTRIYLNKFFYDGCYGGWGICITSIGVKAKSYGFSFYDQPSNMLGCYVMGLLAAAASITSHSRAPLAILGSLNPMQKATSLHLALRTGYCGSLTTFASWQLSMIQLLTGRRSGDGGQWYQFLWGQLLGFELSWASLMFGEQCALLCSRWLQRDGRQAAAQKRELQLAEGRASNGMARAEHVRLPPREAEAGMQPAAEQFEPAGLETASNGRNPSKTSLEQAESATGEQPCRPRPEKACITAVTIGSAVLCILLLTLWIVLAVLDTHQDRRAQWFALLLAPFGCILRWLLSMANTFPPGWLPLGTLAANLLACCIDFIISSLDTYYGFGYWATVVTSGVRVGFSGALSTVSTFVAETSALIKQLPDHVWGHVYPALTIAAATILGTAIYGWSVWARI